MREDDILENLLGLTDRHALAKAEERLSKLRAIELFDADLLRGRKPGTYETLAHIHFQLFQDVHPFAGKLRIQNISKGDFRFASVIYLSENVAKIEQMQQTTFDEVVEKYVEMNIAHPFREGTGRSGRIWLDHILTASLGVAVDWSRVDKQDYLLAMRSSPIKDLEIKHVLSAALTDKVRDRLLFMKGIDASYGYEGLDVYRAESLARERQARRGRQK